VCYCRGCESAIQNGRCECDYVSDHVQSENDRVSYFLNVSDRANDLNDYDGLYENDGLCENSGLNENGGLYENSGLNENGVLGFLHASDRGCEHHHGGNYYDR